MGSKHRHGEHGTFLKMNNVQKTFNRTPLMPHDAAAQRKVLKSDYPIKTN
jgi:hypothetical protein